MRVLLQNDDFFSAACFSHSIILTNVMLFNSSNITVVKSYFMFIVFNLNLLGPIRGGEENRINSSFICRSLAIAVRNVFASH